MHSVQVYDIGTLGQKWTEQDKRQWRERQQVQRSYLQQVVEPLMQSQNFDVMQYGQLDYDTVYPLFAARSKTWQDDKPAILITGGVHGYETSGVQGALRFILQADEQVLNHFNVVVLPCISPWGYETINRWNPLAIDPNRSFYANSPAPEAAQAMAFVESLNVKFIAHIDLHETTDTDNSEFRPALAARDAIVQKTWNIPDGFYLVGDTTKPEPAFQKAVIEAVQKITHIAPADEEGKLIGVPLEQFGVINYAARALGLCMGLTDADFVTTTEVYPDSPLVDDENCILAQVAVINAAIEYLST